MLLHLTHANWSFCVHLYNLHWRRHIGLPEYCNEVSIHSLRLRVMNKQCWIELRHMQDFIEDLLELSQMLSLNDLEEVQAEIDAELEIDEIAGL